MVRGDSTVPSNSSCSADVSHHPGTNVEEYATNSARRQGASGSGSMSESFVSDARLTICEVRRRYGDRLSAENELDKVGEIVCYVGE